MKYLFLLGGAFCGVAVILQFASTIVAILRLNRRDVWFAGHDVGVSVIRPVCGIENYIEETLRSTFQLDYPGYEVVFCAADPNDPVIPIVQRLIATHPNVEARLLIGNTAISANPKLNNLVKGWSYEGFWVTRRDQAAWFTGASRTSMPSLNLTPATIFGK